MRFVAFAPLAALAAIVLAACMQDPGAMPTSVDGRGLYAQYCAECHGPGARGDGPLARALATPPADLTLIQVRNGDVFPQAKVMSIVDGYARSDTVYPGMPSFGALLEGDLVPFDSGDGILTPTPRRLVALVAYLESLQQTR